MNLLSSVLCDIIVRESRVWETNDSKENAIKMEMYIHDKHVLLEGLNGRTVIKEVRHITPTSRGMIQTEAEGRVCVMILTSHLLFCLRMRLSST
jgi:hypothetical protein